MQTLARPVRRIRRILFSLAAILMVVSALAGAEAAQAAPPVGPAPANCTLAGTTRTCELWAKTGILNLPGPTTTVIWGYTDSATGSAQLPGPTLIVNDDETLDIILHNDLSQDTSLAFRGLSLAPDTVGVAPGGTKTYTLTGFQPGTYMYEAGLTATADGQRQVAMGLFGALIVRPAAHADWAYNDAATAFDAEALVILSEIDPLFNADPTGFDLTQYAPKYWLINGKAYPDTDPILAEPADRVLLRYLNAGLQLHSMSTLGMAQTVIANDGSPLAYPYAVVNETIAAGQTLDALMDMPANATVGMKYALFESARVSNNGQAFGGMLTFFQATEPTVTVTVVDTNGAPQAGLSVYPFSGGNWTNLSGTTDANGQAVFTLAFGSYRFRVDLNGTQFFSGATDHCTVPVCKAVTIVVTEPVTVTVMDTDGAPQAGLSVYPFSGGNWTNMSGTTDASGQVSFTLLPGDYNFRADVNGTQFFSGGASGVDTCTIPSCTTDTITVTKSVTVTVVDTDGAPQAGLSVYPFSGASWTFKSGTTDANGQVSFTLLPGDYNFRADLNGTQFFSGGASGVDTCSIPGCTTDAITVTKSVTVTVVDTDGAPQAGLSVYPFSGTTWTGKSGTTDANGQASFTLVPGSYNFRADLNGTQFFSGGASGVDTCSIPGCATNTITVTLPVTVTVVDTNGAPQAGLSVYPFSGTTWTTKSGTTDANGQVPFTLLPGSYNFRADLNGTQFFSGGASGVDTCIIPGAGVDCTADTITVTLPATITVVDTNGDPQSGLSVYPFSGTTWTGKSGTTDVNGQVTFTLVQGSYNFRADLNGTQFFSGGASGVDTCTIPGCTTDGVTVTLPVVVTVTDANSTPQAGLSVYPFSGTTWTGKSGTTDANGQVTFTLLPGNYNFRVDATTGQYFSGGSSGVDTCTIPGCIADSVAVP